MYIMHVGIASQDEQTYTGQTLSDSDNTPLQTTAAVTEITNCTYSTVAVRFNLPW